MKKYRNSILLMIIGGLIGGFVGEFGHRSISLNFNFSVNPRILAFKIFFILVAVMLIIISGLVIHLKSKYHKINLDNIPNSIYKKINSLSYITTLFISISFIWLAVMISKSFNEIEEKYLAVAAINLFISIILQNISTAIYNKYYPNKKLNIYENNADKNLFNKLDEGEKWIIYNSAYSTFQNMQSVYSASIVIVMVLSIFTSIPILLPIVIGLLWIIQTSIYSIKANKYNNEDI